MTSVVNVKVKNIRPEYDNLKEWMANPNNIYIGRQGVVFVDGERWPKQSSEWCNPYKITAGKLTREDVLLKYKEHLNNKLEDSETLRRFVALKGKNLGCWCKPEMCHGDIIKEKLETM